MGMDGWMDGWDVTYSDRSDSKADIAMRIRIYSKRIKMVRGR